MGQYFHTAIKQGDEVTAYNQQVNGDSWNGLKLMEHSWLCNDFVMSICDKIYNQPTNVIWCGDYADKPEDFADIDWVSYKEIWSHQNEDNPIYCIYRLEEDFDYTGKYLVNHDQKTYVSFDLYASKCDDNGWIAHPLPLLTAIGNGRGGGDYSEDFPDYHLVGSWAGNLIEITDTIPEGYELLDVRFIEDVNYDDDRVE